jgi:hypothetical protein
MRKKACKKCGQTFDTDKPGTYLCPACAADSKRRSVFRDRICIDCGATFVGYPKSKRCPDCQSAVNREMDAKIKRDGPKRKLGSIDNCQNCAKKLINIRNIGVFDTIEAAADAIDNFKGAKQSVGGRKNDR